MVNQEVNSKFPFKDACIFLAISKGRLFLILVF